MGRSNGLSISQIFPLIISHPTSMCHGSSSPSAAAWETRAGRSKEPDRAAANQQPILEFPNALTSTEAPEL